MRRAVPTLIAAAMLACASRARFTPKLPPELPDVSRWETSWGRVEFPTKPPILLEYQLYVAPGRPAVYSVTRYRFSQRNAKEAAHEKLQWDKNGRDVRRYDCVPEHKARSMPCRWEELQHGSAAYNDELTPILRVYGTHAQLLRERDEGRR